VLRGGKGGDTHADSDDLQETFHVGAIDDNGKVIGTSTYFPSVCQYEPEIADAYRLRSLAVAPGQQGEGIGGSIIDRAIQMLQERVAVLLWANARDTALKFYLDRDFTAIAGSEFSTPESRIPHTVVVRRLEA
jgi:GNAT superfamily N-acetyltransferase